LQQSTSGKAGARGHTWLKKRVITELIQYTLTKDGLGQWAMKGAILTALAVQLWLGLSGLEAYAEKRVALVIGNATYQNSPRLGNPRNDASDLADALKRVSFDVVLEQDLDKRGMERAIAQFARDARDADAALFYYAGHGLQHRGLNYLMPIDAKLEDEFSLNFEMARLEDVLLSLGQARGVKILVLDACRNNPLVERLAAVASTRDFVPTRGLAQLDAVRGMIVAYATQADHVAADGSGRNSPFTAALVKQINEPGLEIGTLFRRVASDVNRMTGGRQLPELSVSLLGEFYFTRVDSDVQAWVKVRTSGDTTRLKDFITLYSSSPLVTDARERLEAIDRAEQARIEKEKPEREKAERERQAREQAQREQFERERLARERTDRERLQADQAEQARMERDRLAREQAEWERQQREKVERERLAAEQARRENGEQETPSSQPTNIQTAALPPPKEPPPAHIPPLAGGALVLEIKKELKRVGCYKGRIDQNWSTKEMQAPVQNSHGSPACPGSPNRVWGF